MWKTKKKMKKVLDKRKKVCYASNADGLKDTTSFSDV